MRVVFIIAEPKKTVSSQLTNELNSDMSSSFRGNPAFQSGEDVINQMKSGSKKAKKLKLL